MLSYKQGLGKGKLKASKYAESCRWVSFAKISLTKPQMATVAVHQATYNGLAFGAPVLDTCCREKQPDRLPAFHHMIISHGKVFI